jgi:hypothetical protein
MHKQFVFAVLFVAALVVLPGAHASNPSSSTVSAASPSTWIGGPFAASSPSLAPECVDGSPSCDTHALTVVPAPGNYSLEINVRAAVPTDDYDLYVYDSNGVQVGSDGAPPGIPERVVLENPPGGVYTVKVLAFLVAPGSTYTATATLHGNTGTVITDPNPDTVLWDWNREAPQATVEVPLRVVAVGFAPGELDAAKVLGEVADVQRPGVLIPRGNDTNGDTFPLFGAETLVNHGRRYYEDSRPYLVPYEYKWKPELVYAPSTFASGLFGAMKANSTTGEFANSRNRQFIESYNATRGAFRGTGALVPPNHPVRFVDGEKTEDWIAANAPAYLGFDHPKRGKGAGTNPGYTVYVLNTWDSAEARAQLQPQGEYHVFKINRNDPDTQQFDGIDWARIWGGRYRFMMVDLGAAPNPYEAETWGNRNRSVYGSANYDPPLWEYRANAPRPVTLTNLTEGEGNLDIEQAVTPGETWDGAELNRMLGRTVGQAVSFRFLHSYLYEPWPSTGKYWLSDNVWHDANAELPWASDLTKLYDQETVMAGLRTLTPYFEFEGDTVFEYLGEGGPDYTADQAMLDQAKRDGDDIGGVPGAGMHTVTAMDYLDSKPDRFLRGGPCFTTVPGISVVAEKHYAWALAIAAGIATNRNGVPWGYLNSVNDVFKTPQADRDQTMRLAHPEVGTGAFTYTAIHEASHYLGLAHPHDSIGATRNTDGTPRYYDGFTWAFNSTAAPTTYSHSELVYSILDQESIARGHAAYYLKWTNEALTDGGVAYWQAGVKTVGALPAVARKLRDRAVTQMAKARAAFSRFEFVTATFAAQAAWRAAAAYRDLALALPPGTTEIEKGTQKEGASACASAKEPNR